MTASHSGVDRISTLLERHQIEDIYALSSELGMRVRKGKLPRVCCGIFMNRDGLSMLIVNESIPRRFRPVFVAHGLAHHLYKDGCICHITRNTVLYPNEVEHRANQFAFYLCGKVLGFNMDEFIRFVQDDHWGGAESLVRYASTCDHFTSHELNIV